MSSILPQGYIKWNGITYAIDSSNIITGPPGTPGLAGVTGINGSIGPTGSIGPQGLQGSPGVVGVTGPTGSVGPTGVIGPEGSAGPTGGIGPTGPAGLTGAAGADSLLNSVDSTLTIVSPELRRTAITGHISIPTGSNISSTALLPPTAALTAAKAGVPYILHRSLIMAGNAGQGGTIITGSQLGFPNGFPFNGLLVDAWLYCTGPIGGSSVQIFSSSGILTGLIPTGSLGINRNTDTQTRLINFGDIINATKTGALFLGLRFDVFLVFIPFG